MLRHVLSLQIQKRVMKSERKEVAFEAWLNYISFPFVPGDMEAGRREFPLMQTKATHMKQWRQMAPVIHDAIEEATQSRTQICSEGFLV